MQFVWANLDGIQYSDLDSEVPLTSINPNTNYWVQTLFKAISFIFKDKLGWKILKGTKSGFKYLVIQVFRNHTLDEGIDMF